MDLCVPFTIGLAYNGKYSIFTMPGFGLDHRYPLVCSGERILVAGVLKRVSEDGKTVEFQKGYYFALPDGRARTPLEHFALICRRLWGLDPSCRMAAISKHWFCDGPPSVCRL